MFEKFIFYLFSFPIFIKKNIFTGAFIGEYCNETFSCYGDSDCIDYRCQCDPYKGLVPRYTQNIDIYYTYCIRAASFQNNTDECFYSTHCKPPMICKNSKCTCPEQNQYYDKNLQTCIWSGLYLHTCSSGQRNQCAGLGPKGKCTGSLCKCGNIANPVPYWYNATEMVNGTVRYMCEAGKYIDDSLKIFSINQLKMFFFNTDVENNLGGPCSVNPYKFGNRARVCNLTLLCVECPFSKEEVCGGKFLIKISYLSSLSFSFYSPCQCGYDPTGSAGVIIGCYVTTKCDDVLSSCNSRHTNSPDR